MLNPNAKKWVEALRSGQYQQTQGALHKETGWCCLGVACDLYAKKFPILRNWKSNHEYFDGCALGTPGIVAEWLGLRTTVGSFLLSNGEYSSLAGMNDAGVRFSVIANLIESAPSGLFVDGEEKEV